MERIQLSYKHCWAITIDKSQGPTLPNTRITSGMQEKSAGLSYVAISRIKGLYNLILNQCCLKV